MRAAGSVSCPPPPTRSSASYVSVHKGHQRSMATQQQQQRQRQPQRRRTHSAQSKSKQKHTYTEYLSCKVSIRVRPKASDSGKTMIMIVLSNRTADNPIIKWPTPFPMKATSAKRNHHFTLAATSTKAMRCRQSITALSAIKLYHAFNTMNEGPNVRASITTVE